MNGFDCCDDLGPNPPLPAVRLLEAHLAALDWAREQIERARQVDAWLGTRGQHELAFWRSAQFSVRAAFQYVDSFRAACESRGLDPTGYLRGRVRLVAISEQAASLQRELSGQAA